jgi:TRAP transporter TAXI family solute receptor
MKARVFGVLAMFIAVLAGSMSARSAEPHWPDALVIGTASPGGTYYAYGEGLARILTRALGIRVSMRPTEGPNENILLLENSEIQIGFITTGSGLQAWNGSGDWTQGRRFQSMRVMFPMYDTPIHFLALEESGIRSLADLTGKRVGVGPQGGTSGTYIPTFFETLGIKASLNHGEWSNLAAQMEQRQLDALAVASGVPFPAFAELEAKNKVAYIPITQEQITALDLAMPELEPSVIPPGSYPSLTNAYQTVGLYNLAVAHESLPNDLVYNIIKAVFAYHDEMMAAHPAAASTIPANFTRNTFLPFHGGAVRYYQEIGVSGVAISD